MRRAWVLAGMAGIAGITGITGIAGVAGCGGRSAGEPSESAAEVVQARGALDLLARGDVDTFVRTWDVSTRPADLAETVGQVAAGFPHATPDRVRPVGARCGSVHEVGGLTTETCVVTFESNYADGTIVSEITMRRIGGDERRLVGFHATALPAPLAVVDAFTLSGKGPVHFVFLVTIALVEGVTLLALVIWFRRRKTVRRRWWWLAAILVGTFAFVLNWTSGEITVRALTVQLLSLGVSRAIVDGPLMLSLSIPAGAVTFLLVHRRAGAAPAVSPPVISPPAG